MGSNYVGSHIIFHKIIYNHEGKALHAVLLYKRTQDADNHPGCWGLIGGRIEEKDRKFPDGKEKRKEEMAADAVDREAREELNCCLICLNKALSPKRA